MVAKLPEKQRRVVTVNLGEVYPDQFDTNLSSILVFVQELISEHGEDAYLEWDPTNLVPYETEYSPTYWLKRTVLETDAQLTMRLEQEKDVKAEREQRERAEFERLSKKFGG